MYDVVVFLCAIPNKHCFILKSQYFSINA